MTARHASLIALVGIGITGWLSPPLAAADPVTKEMCIDAHSRGQDAKEAGKISLARKLFLTCAQPSCPALVQGDCARFADDLIHQASSLTFVARDARGADLVDTAVYLDDALVVSRLDDGKPHDVDPGRHTIRFVSRGKEQTVALVVGTGEQGRAVVATFPTINVPPPGTVLPGGSTQPEITVFHPRGAKIMIGVGAAVTLAGIAVGTIGFLGVPSNCTISSNHCAAPPGDPAFDKASSGVRLLDIGIGVGVAGAAVLTGGLVWYFSRSVTETSDGRLVMPMVLRDGGGVAWSGSF
jgi:hypothetical protein